MFLYDDAALLDRVQRNCYGSIGTVYSGKTLET
jgi:hypothetical protein